MSLELNLNGYKFLKSEAHFIPFTKGDDMLPFCRVNFYHKSDNITQGRIRLKEVGDFCFYEHEDGIMLSDGSSFAVVHSDFATIDMHLPYQWGFAEHQVMFLLLNAYRYVLVHNGHFQIHSAVVTKDGYGVAFCGLPGAGKSTQAHLWEEHLDAQALNLDQPVILFENDEVLVSGSPWSGKEDCYKSDTAPLKAIVFVQQAKENSIQSMSKAEAYSLLFLNNFMVPVKDEIEEKHKEAVLKIVTKVPCYKLCCTISKEAVEVAYDMIFKDTDKEK
ncbi:MAG: hypothetical protein Q4A12_03200 [Eubacteriales bacterium]|nr:hypothetical protein [Eubacteriales bacterium]